MSSVDLPQAQAPAGAMPASDTGPRPAVALLTRIATGWALAGGGLFCAIALMSIVSILSRKLFNAPIQGDVELLQMGAAVGAATFLPLCEAGDQHIRVDALTSRLAPGARARLDALAHGMLAVMAGLLTWRTGLYMVETYQTGEVSTLLLVPLWIPVGLMLPSLALLAAVAAARMRESALSRSAVQA